MGLEVTTYINGLVPTNPTSSDPKSQGDDHIRLIKTCLLNTLPNITGPMNASSDELNYMVGCTDVVQDQLDALAATKADLDSPPLTGTPTAPTAPTGTTGSQIATLDFVIATSLAGTLPGQTGNASKFISTDGNDPFWSDEIDVAVMKPSVGTDLATTTGTQKLENKLYEDPIFCDGTGDDTKRLAWNLTRVGTGTQRVVDVYDEDVLLFTPGRRLLATVSASNSATVDVEFAYNNTYDLYIIEAYDIVPASNSTDLMIRLKKGGSYLTGSVYSYRTDTPTNISGATSITALPNLDNDDVHESYLQVTLVRPFDTTRGTLISMQGGTDGSSLAAAYPVGLCTTTGAVQGIRFYMSTGKMTSGTFKLYGVRK